MVGLLHAMVFMVLLLIGWVIWNNKPLPFIWTDISHANSTCDNATGLLIRSSENVPKTNKVSTRKLWYELIAPRSYMVKRTYETLYLLIPTLHMKGSGYVHFNPNPSNAGYNRQRKCMRINNQLYEPLPIGFEGMIRQNQSSGLLQIFPLIHLVVNLIDHAEITASTSSGVYNTSGFVMINCRRLEYYT